jgi:hypothetical protein
MKALSVCFVRRTLSNVLTSQQINVALVVYRLNPRSVRTGSGESGSP